MLEKANQGEIFIAEHVRLGKKRVIKRVRKNHPFYNKLAGEAFLLGKLNHPGIVRLEDVEEDDEYLYLIEEYVQGTSLKHLVLSDNLTEHQIIQVMLQICHIIQYLHSQKHSILYLDLKPEHLLLSPEGVLTLIDFGSAVQMNGETIVRQADCMQLTDTHQDLVCFGTRGYAPPELYGSGRVGPYSDVYEIGCVLYFMLTGVDMPENGLKNVHNTGRLSGAGELWEAVRHCVKSEPKQRWELEKLIRVLEKRNGRKKKGQRRNIFSQGRRLIGVVGAHPGAGVTHISLLLSFYLARQTGKSVAFLEYHHHGDCMRYLSRTEEQVSFFQKGKVEFFPGVSQMGLAQLLNDDYEIYVIDFGCEIRECLTEYLHCEDKLVVTQLTEWKLDLWEAFCARLQEIFRQDEWHCFYNLATVKQSREQEGKGICFPWEPDVRHPSAQTERIFAEWFGIG